MRGSDLLGLSLGALREHRLRSALSILGIAIGIGAVILLTSLGEGARRSIVATFTQFGTNVLAINPGKTETVGLPGVLGGTTRPLTLEDAAVLERVAGVDVVMPLAMGNGKVEGGGRSRSVTIFGVTDVGLELWKMALRQGRYLPGGDITRGANVCVLGARLKAELFGERNALGEWVRIAGWRLKVIGVMAPKGEMLGFDMDDLAHVPVATAMRMFNLEELFEIDVTYAHEDVTDEVVAGITRLLTERHGGHEDFTITTQAAMLEVFGSVMDVITAAVGAIAGISLLVGAIGILTMMWIAVGERTTEIGLMRALGATTGQIQGLFLVEAVGLAAVGGMTGLAGGMGIAALASWALPSLPLHTPLRFVVAAIAVSALTGLVSGVMPARRAARLDPVEALHGE